MLNNPSCLWQLWKKMVTGHKSMQIKVHGHKFLRVKRHFTNLQSCRLPQRRGYCAGYWGGSGGVWWWLGGCPHCWRPSFGHQRSSHKWNEGWHSSSASPWTHLWGTHWKIAIFGLPGISEKKKKKISCIYVWLMTQLNIWLQCNNLFKEH